MVPLHLGYLSVGCAIGVGVCCAIYETRRKRSFQGQRKQQPYAVPEELVSNNNNPYNEELQVVMNLALTAGDRLFDFFEAKGTNQEQHHQLKISEKGKPSDFCTNMDTENEQIIASGLLQRFPTHQVIGEEASGSDMVPPLTFEPTWIIDPIDGTTNFASGLPLVCVSIGFCCQGTPVLGVVYAPLTRELYIAVAGCGAFRNGVRLVSSHVQRTKKLHDAIVCAEFGYTDHQSEIDTVINALHSIVIRGCRAVRMIGSGVLDLCYVASGRLDVVYAGVASEGWKPWDYCAASVIVQEAGCCLESIRLCDCSDTNARSSFDLYGKNHICASNYKLLEEIRQVLMHYVYDP